MKDYRGPTPAERQEAATKARLAALQKFREKALDPELAQRKAKQATDKAQRAVVKETRDRERGEQKAREAELAAEAERQAAEQAARELEQKRETEIAEAAERKAARAARYAARKLRTKK